MSAQQNNGFDGAFPMPIGSVLYWAGKTSSRGLIENAGWIIPTGQTLLKADYPDLAFLLGGAYSLSDTTFKPPNLVRTTALDNPYSFLLGSTTPDQDIVSDIGSVGTPDTATILLTADNLPTLSLSYVADSLTKSFRAMNDTGGFSDPADVFRVNQPISRDNDSDENPKFQRFTDGDTATGDWLVKSANIDIAGTYEGLQPIAVNFDSGSIPDPIDITADITLDADITAPKIELVPIMKARWG